MEGYVRQNGRPGIRNTVQVIFMVECASHVAKKIAEGFPCHDVQYFGFSGCYPSDYGYRLVKNLATHSNVRWCTDYFAGVREFRSPSAGARSTRKWATVPYAGHSGK